jgi:5,10-methylene-tetrahydrofolate dehydrogenase/methenyl tetrahydrofolate cyclohydrolase
VPLKEGIVSVFDELAEPVAIRVHTHDGCKEPITDLHSKFILPSITEVIVRLASKIGHCVVLHAVVVGNSVISGRCFKLLQDKTNYRRYCVKCSREVDYT